MWLSGALFALFVTGLWLYCLTDAIMMSSAEFRGLSKPAWIVVIAATFVGGAVAWLILRPPARSSSARGPDDDPEFLRALDRAIRGSSQAGEEV